MTYLQRLRELLHECPSEENAVEVDIDGILKLPNHLCSLCSSSAKADLERFREMLVNALEKRFSSVGTVAISPVGD